MALCCYDEAYTIPSEKAARVALRTMQILIEEMGLCDTVDPLAGSYYVETLTNELEAKIRELMDDLNGQGGIVPAIAAGHIQNTVSRQAYEERRKLEAGEIRKVGVNCYQMEEEEDRPVELHPFREEVCAEQVQRLDRVKSQRDGAAVTRALREVVASAKDGRNVMPPMIEAVKAYATVGELTHCLVEAYGRYEEPLRF
jgi:methylmalonyl-CoA mutase N-terminal domain/subunit